MSEENAVVETQQATPQAQPEVDLTNLTMEEFVERGGIHGKGNEPEKAVPEPVKPVEEVKPVETQGNAKTELEPEKEFDPADLANVDGGKHTNRAQKRIKTLVAERQKAEQDAAYWRGIAEAGGKKPENAQPQPGQPQPEASGKPKREDYGPDEDYVEALTDWKLEQRLPVAFQRISEQQQEQAVRSKFIESEQAVKGKYTDYDTVIAGASNVMIPEFCSAAILNSANGADIRYHLAKNPDIANSLSQMHPYAALMKIGELSAQISSEKVAPKKVPQAPPPINAPQAGSFTQAEKKPEEMTQAEYNVWAAKNVKNRRY